MAGDLRKVMPKPNSKKKESVSANLQEDDLPSNFEKSEIENDTLILGEAAPSARKNDQKSKAIYFVIIIASGLATATFGLGGAFLINSFYPNLFKNQSQIIFEQNVEFRLDDLSTSIKQLEFSLNEAKKISQNFIDENKLVTSLAGLEDAIIKNKEEFDSIYLELGDLKKQLETKLTINKALGSEERTPEKEILPKMMEENEPSDESLRVEPKRSNKLKTNDNLIYENIQAIQTATIYGNPFEENLKNIETVLKLEAPEILRNLASTGIPTMTDLIESFPDFARLALAADRKLTETGNFKILKFLKSQLQARSTIPREGFDTDAILSRSEAFLKSNDLENSLFELSQLNDIAKEAMEPWRISAENRIETLLAVEQFVESIKE
ncbi:MAG: hypothetical protein CML53_05985 [Rhodobacteraceae bacterium]|nr:hypothetical protein [Paracoccaceae bacterium]